MTDADVCNMALGMIGAQTITALTDSSQAARQCTIFHDQSRNELLRLVAWNFAIKRVDLTDLVADGETYNDWSYAYVLPSDCLRVLGLTAYDPQTTFDSTFPEWKVENGSILSESEDLTLLYTRIVTDPDDYDPLFTRTLVYHLASTLAVAIKQSPDMRDFYYGLYREALYQARNLNHTERRTAVTSSWWSDRSETARDPWPNMH